MQRAIGIDLGTTNSVMAYMRRGEPVILLNRENSDAVPSVIGKGRRGELLIGDAARGRMSRGSTDVIFSVKRFIGRKFSDPSVQRAIQMVPYPVKEAPDGDVLIGLGDHFYTPTELSSLILHKLKTDAESRLGEKFTRAVITVPAYFGERQVAATRDAGRMAGFHVLRIINEPTAAALAYGLDRDPDEDTRTVLVYDLGGGTFDISILMLMQGTFTVMGIEGDNLLGGDDFDYDLAAHLRESIRLEHSIDVHADRAAQGVVRSFAEKAKIELSNLLATEVNLPSLGSEGLPVSLEVERSTFEQLIRPRLEHSMNLTQKAILEAHLNADHIDYILLVGGSTNVPLVESMLRSLFGAQKIRRNVNPMQSVALGAAIQTALISEIECNRCQHINAIQNDQCERCSTSLSGSDKYSCPQCFMLSDAGAAVCWKCDTPLGATADAAVAHSVVNDRCPKCGKPYAPGMTTCSICSANPQEQGGLKCIVCGAVNAPGAQACLECGRELQVRDVLDMTPKDLGIELQDGRFAVLIPKNTTFPTVEPYSKEFYTAAPNQQRLEVAVYEGSESVAVQNDLCGIVTLGLPGGLPKGTPINIAFGLDLDRTLTVSVRVRAAQNTARSVRIQRGSTDPERKQRVVELRERLAGFVDRFQSDLTVAERNTLYSSLERLEATLADEVLVGSQQRIDELLGQTLTTLEQITQARGRSAYLSAVINGAGNYLSQETRQRVTGRLDEIRRARETGDMVEAAAVAATSEAEDSDFGTGVLLIMYARSFVGRFSPGLALKVNGALRDIDEGAESNSGQRVEQGISTLHALFEDMSRELGDSGDLQTVVKPQDKRV